MLNEGAVSHDLADTVDSQSVDTAGCGTKQPIISAESKVSEPSFSTKCAAPCSWDVVELGQTCSDSRDVISQSVKVIAEATHQRDLLIHPASYWAKQTYP